MSGRLVVHAMAFAKRLQIASAAAVHVTSRGLRNVTAPLMSDVCALDRQLFALVLTAPTVSCTAELRVDSLDGPSMQRVPDAFPQLRRIEVCTRCEDAKALALTLSRACADGSTIRAVLLMVSCVVTDAMVAAIAPAVGRLETLALENSDDVSLDVLRAHLGGMSRLRAFDIGHARTMADDHLAAMLAESPLLRSLTVRNSPHLTGAFLAALPAECYVGMREIQIASCNVFDDAGAAQLAHFRGLKAMNVQQCPRITSLPLARMPPLRRTGAFFMYQNTGLTAIDLSVLANITVVDSHFLRGCRSLTALDVSPLKHVVSVDPLFLSGCSDITELDLSSLNHLVSIDSGFLASCFRLQTLDLSGLTNVVSIGHAFLEHCRSLVTLDLSAMKNVSTIGTHFLASCVGLEVLDLLAMRNVISLGVAFLADCSELRRLRLSEALLRHEDAIGDQWRRMHAETGCDDES